MTIFAHQDDETFSAGGILAKYGSRGYAVSVTYDSKREIEFQDACKKLGVNPIQLSFQNVSQSNQNQIKNKLVEIIRSVKPTNIITHINFDYHEEHKKVREIVEEAVEWASHNTDEKNNAHQIEGLWAAETTVLIPKPEIFIDITSENEKRVEAIKIYDSQSQKGGEGFYLAFHNTRTQLRGIQAGVAHAEAFIQVPILRSGSFKPIRYFNDLP